MPRNPSDDPRSIIDEILNDRHGRPFANLADAQCYLDARVQAYNARPQKELGGLSPLQMTQLLSGDWSTTGAIMVTDTLDPSEIGDPDTLHNARALLSTRRAAIASTITTAIRARALVDARAQLAPAQRGGRQRRYRTRGIFRREFHRRMRFEQLDGANAITVDAGLVGDCAHDVTDANLIPLANGEKQALCTTTRHNRQPTRAARCIARRDGARDGLRCGRLERRHLAERRFIQAECRGRDFHRVMRVEQRCEQ